MMGELGCSRRRGSGFRAVDAMLPRDHPLRRSDRLIDMGELRAALACHYSSRGRPSIDPELLIRMTLIGRIYAIPSERRLCEEVRYNLAYRWFCRLPLGAAVPHHSTFSKNRHGRFRDAGVFRLLFENTVRRCLATGLIGAKDAAIDASFIAADASWQRKLRDGDLDHAAISRPVREWLADQALSPVPDNGPRRGAPAELSRTDPAAAWSARTARGRFGYAFNLLMDAPSGAALDVEAAPARHAAEVDAGRDMLARAAERFGYRPKRVTADTAYGSAAFLAFIHDQGAMPHIPMLERSEQTKGKFSRAAFAFDRERDRYTCPNGKALEHRLSENGSVCTSTRPSPRTAACARSRGDAPTAVTASYRAWPTRTRATWCVRRCRLAFISAPCGCVAGSSGCSRTPRSGAAWPGFAFADSRVPKKSS